MSNPIPTLLLFGVVLLLLIAPFSAFAPLVLIIVVSVIASMSLTFLRTLLTGATRDSDRLPLKKDEG